MTQGELEGIPVELEKAFSELEIRIMSDIVRRIKINGFATASADWQTTRLQQLGRSEEDIKEWIQDVLEVSDQELERIFSDTVYEEYYGHERAYTAHGRKQKPIEDNEEMQKLIRAVKRQTAETFHNITGSMGFAFQDPSGKIDYTELMEFYQKTLDAAMLDIHSGAFSYQEVLERTINTMTKSGIRWVDYESGHHNRIDVAARRAIMTGFRQVQEKINEQVAADLGTDSYEVTYHVGARPTHQPWQGRVWTKEQLISVCGLGTVTGLHGANCYHDYNTFIPGVSVRTYTDEQLDQMITEENRKKEYNGKEYTTYEALQQQRKMETAMRKTRRDIRLLQDGESDKDALTLKKAKYQGQMQTYKDFSKKMGLPEQLDRVKIPKGIPKTKLGAGKSNKDASGKPIFLGEVDLEHRHEAIRYYNEQIRNEKIEYAFVIDRKGKVYYSVGDEDAVGLEGIDLTGAIITHNHPEANGIVSFSEDDFKLLQNNQAIRSLIAVNREYTYSVEIAKMLDRISYHEFYRKAMEEAELGDPDFDLQHKVFEILDREGYVKYVREKFVGETEEND